MSITYVIADTLLAATALQSVFQFDASSYAKRMEGRCSEFEHTVESRGNMCMKTYEAFEANEEEMKLPNLLKTRAIAEAGLKMEKLDSRVLGHLLRADLMTECYPP